MKEKTFLHLHRNDVSMTLGGAFIEHPLSTHSASIGRRRNIRGMKYVSMLLMALMLCVGNVWGATIWDNPAGISTIGTGENQKVYPEFDVWYYVYAQNHVTNYTNQKIFWVWHTQTNYYEVRQTASQTTDDIPANLIQVKFTKDATTDTVRIWAMTPDNVEKELFFRGSAGGVLMAQKEGNVAKYTTENQKYWNPKWTFTYESKEVNINNNNKTIYSFAIEGKRKIYSSGNYADYSNADVRAVYKKVNNAYNDFNSSVIALKTASSTSGTTAAPYLTKWSFIKVPQKYNAAPTAGGDTGHGGTVEVSTNGTDWVYGDPGISNHEISAGDRIYFKATTPTDAENYEFVGWYKEGTTDQSSGSNNLVDSRLAFDIPASAGNHNYVAVYRYKRTIYYSITANVNNSTLGSAQVSLNQDNWTGALSTLTGSFRSGFKNPQITFYFKTTSTDPAINLQRWNPTPWSTSKYNTTNTAFTFDQTTGIMTLPVTVYSPSEFTSSNPFVITLTAKFTPAIFYKGIAQKKSAWSAVDACAVKVGTSSSYNWNDATNEVSGFIGVEAEEGGSANKDIYFKAIVSDPNRYRAKGWYNGDTEVSSEADYHQVVAVTSYDQENPTTLTLQADFEESTQKYYRAVVEASPNVGTVKAGFSDDLTSANATANASAYNFNESFERTAYFEAILPPSGYEFRGWSMTSDEADIIEGARNLTYHESFTVSSIDSEEPNTITRYAIFRAVDAQEVQMWDADDTSLGKGDFADAIANSNVAKIKLLRSVTLAGSATIIAPATIDLDGYDINGTTMTINPGTGKEVKFINTDSHGFGKVYLDTEANGVSVASGNLILDGADIRVVGNGDNTYGISVANGATFTSISGNLNVYAMNNAYGLLVNGNAQLQGGTITVRATTNNAGAVYTNDGSSVTISGSAELVATAGTASSAFALKHVGGTVSILGGGFRGGEQDITYASASNITLHAGYFAHNAGLSSLVSEPYVVSEWIPSGTKFSTSDYHYMVVSRNSPSYPLCIVISKKKNNPTLRYNFSTLEAAIAYVNNNVDDDREKTILLLEDYTLPAGNYTIPFNAILSVPYSADQTDAMPNLQRISTNDAPTSAYCTLTLASAVHIDVHGAIEVGGTQTAGNIDAAGSNGVSRPGGPTYGLMQMNSGSSITLYNNAIFYAWGFVIGEGTIDVRRGAVVKEQFQIMDWKGFTPTALMAVGGSIDYTLHVLPINQYFIQNVEVKATYRPGSRLKAQVSACVQGLTLAFNDIGIIGVRYSDAEKAEDDDLKDDVAIFLMDNNDDSEDTWVRKSYDVANDVQLYEANNSAYLGSLLMDIDVSQSEIQFGNITVQDLNVDSRDFVLPLANNFKIHLKNGTLVVTQNTVILPGAVMEIDKKATMTITDQVWRKVNNVYQWVTEPQTLYVYDKDQWGTYTFVSKPGEDYIMGYGARIRYRHGGLQKERTLTPEGLGHGQLIVHGTVDVKGYLKTTNGDKTATPVISQTDKGKDYVSGVTETPHSPSTGGASITSTIADAGTITLSRNAGNVTSGGHSSYIWQVNEISSTGTPSYFGNHAIPAWLTNEAGSVYSAGDGYTETAGTTAGKSFCFIDFDGDGKGEWVSLVEDGCFVKDGDDYYAKPKDYVKLLHGKTAEEDHTYKSADGTRTLILVDDCQWWEVVQVEGHPDLFECQHPDNHIFYYYDYESSKWKEKRYTIIWNEWDGEEWERYSVKYGVKPQYLGTIPERPGDAYYTYDFIGWSPEITDQTIVTGDVTYTAQYQRNDVMYTVTWKDLSGNTIEIGYCKIGDIPTCTSEIDMTGKEWTPAVGAVTGNMVYQLAAKEVKANYTIKWNNWNGTTLQTTTPAAGTAAATVLAGYTAGTPTKAALADVAFEFAGWTPTVVDANADAIYTATFTEQPITYAITWKKGSKTLLVQNVTPNTVPQYTGATPTNGEEYAFVGWTPTVVAATADAEYTAVFELREKTVDGETYTVPASTQQSLTTITIKDDGVLSIPASSSMTVTNLILEANNNASGQIFAPANSNIITVNAYYDLNLDIDGRHWFAFGVPWVVNLDVTPLTEVESGRTLVLGRDYEIVYYNGATRATQGAGAHCWEKVADGTHILQPGKGYMIAFAGHINTVRFAKATGTPVIFNGTVKLQNEYGDGDNNGWNGLANPMAFHAKFTDGPTVGYVHNGEEIGHDGYTECNLENKRMIVGKMVYVQVASNADVTPVQATTGEFVAAPARRTNTGKATDKQYLSLNDYYQVSIADANEQGGSVYVLPEENKEDKYVIGHDLSHLGISDQKAQIWVFRYGTKLALNTTAPIDDVAEYALRVYAPKNGEYTITNNQSPVSDDEYVVYLTRNGEAIWNLSDGAYTTDLTSGVHKEYGLRLSARKTPAVVTGIDEAIVDANGETRKVLINNQVFIIRGNEVYTIDGQMVK